VHAEDRSIVGAAAYEGAESRIARQQSEVGPGMEGSVLAAHTEEGGEALEGAVGQRTMVGELDLQLLTGKLATVDRPRGAGARDPLQPVPAPEKCLDIDTGYPRQRQLEGMGREETSKVQFGTAARLGGGQGVVVDSVELEQVTRTLCQLDIGHLTTACEDALHQPVDPVLGE
jgi:hypothetical protein